MIDLHYINLKKRKERRSSLEKNFSVRGFDVIDCKRFDAIEHEFGEIGCAKSHFLLTSTIQQKRNIKYHIILEDDFRFTINLKQLYRLVRIIEDVNPNFDIFHLFTLRPIASVVKKISFREQKANLCRILSGQSTAAYIVRHDKLPQLSRNFLRSLQILERSKAVLKAPHLKGRFNFLFAIDNFWNKIQADGNCLAFDIQIGEVEEGYSDVAKSVKSISNATMQKPFGYKNLFFDN